MTLPVKPSTKARSCWAWAIPADRRWRSWRARGDPEALLLFQGGRGTAPASLEFSFSGLKTSLRYQLEKLTPAVIETRRADLCASYQRAVFESLVRKSRLALERGAYRSFGLSGGVANNRTLQGELEKVARENSISFHRAQPQHTGDNAGMIAFAAWVEREAGGVREDGFALEIAPSLPLALV